jgi:hypothetical protein
MRLACVFIIASLAACGGASRPVDPGGNGGPDLATSGRDLATSGRDLATSDGADLCQSPGCGEPGCPEGTQAPPYYMEDGTLPCSTVGEVCTYFESGLTCLCDHHWWYTDCGTGPCPPPDGGFPICDGGA